MFFFYFVLRGCLGLITRVMGPSTLNFFFIVLSSSHDSGYEFVTPPNSSFNIVFHWELRFMICFNLLFIRLSWSHNLKIVLNGLTHIDLTYFYVICFDLLSIELSQSYDQSLILFQIWSLFS